MCGFLKPHGDSPFIFGARHEKDDEDSVENISSYEAHPLWLDLYTEDRDERQERILGDDDVSQQGEVFVPNQPFTDEDWDEPDDRPAFYQFTDVTFVKGMDYEEARPHFSGSVTVHPKDKRRSRQPHRKGQQLWWKSRRRTSVVLSDDFALDILDTVAPVSD